MTDKLVTADAAKLLVDGGIRRIYRADSHIGERGWGCVGRCSFERLAGLPGQSINAVGCSHVFSFGNFKEQRSKYMGGVSTVVLAWVCSLQQQW